jgi:hypothetical protein
MGMLASFGGGAAMIQVGGCLIACFLLHIHDGHHTILIHV